MRSPSRCEPVPAPGDRATAAPPGILPSRSPPASAPGAGGAGRRAPGAVALAAGAGTPSARRRRRRLVLLGLRQCCDLRRLQGRFHRPGLRRLAGLGGGVASRFGAGSRHRCGRRRDRARSGWRSGRRGCRGRGRTSPGGAAGPRLAPGLRRARQGLRSRALPRPRREQEGEAAVAAAAPRLRRTSPAGSRWCIWRWPGRRSGFG